MVIMLGISPRSLDILFKYMRALRKHLQKKVMLFKSRTIDEACVQAQHLENIGIKKDNQVVLNRNTTNMLPRRERRNGNEKTRRQYTLHISARIQTTIATIVIEMVTLNISVESYIHI